MNQEQTGFSFAKMLGGLAVGGFISYLFFSEEKRPRRPRRSNSTLSGTKRKLPARTLAREEFEAEERKRLVADGIPTRNHPFPNRSITKASSESRSEKYSASVIDSTEKVSVISTRPEIRSSSKVEDIKKYPPFYYTLSKSAKKRYRMKLNNNETNK